MKTLLKILSLSILVAAAIFSRALRAEDFKLRNVGGFYKIPVQLNSVITLDFALDSGASDVSMSDEVVDALLKSGAMNATDIKGTRIYTLADGSEVTCRAIVIRKVQMGTQVATDVEGSTCPGKAPLLLGQSFLKKIGKWFLDFDNNILEVKGKTEKVALLTPVRPPAPKPPSAPVKPPSEAAFPAERVEPVKNKIVEARPPSTSGESCDFDMNNILNGPSNEQAETVWNCRAGKTPARSWQLFADGTGWEQTLGKIIWKKTGCRSFEYHYASRWYDATLGPRAVTDLYGDVNYGTLTMTYTDIKKNVWDIRDLVCVRHDK